MTRTRKVTTTIQKDPTGGWLVRAYVDDALRREVWTAGSKRDAKTEERQLVAELSS